MIECIYDWQTEFSATQADNPRHIQVKAEHPLWHKENLLNIAIKHLPQDW